MTEKTGAINTDENNVFVNDETGNVAKNVTMKDVTKCNRNNNGSVVRPMTVVDCDGHLNVITDESRGANEIYVGEAHDHTALESQPKWRIKQIYTSNGITKEFYAGYGEFNQVWDDRYNLSYLEISDVLLDSTDVTDNTKHAVIGNLSAIGGHQPIVYSITTQDAGNYFYISGTELRINNVMPASSTANVTIRATDEELHFVEKEFTITEASQTFDYTWTLNGVDENLHANQNVTALNITNKMSVCMWVKSGTSATMRMMSTYKTKQSFDFQQTTSNRLACYLYSDGTASVNKLVTVTGLQDDSWKFVCFVYDYTEAVNDDRLKLYVNGVEQTGTLSGTAPATLYNGTDTNLSIGAYYDGATGGNYFNGEIDDFIVTNTALTSVEITDLYNSGSPKDMSQTAGIQWGVYMADNYTSGTVDTAHTGPDLNLVNMDIANKVVV